MPRPLIDVLNAAVPGLTLFISCFVALSVREAIERIKMLQKDIDDLRKGGGPPPAA